MQWQSEEDVLRMFNRDGTFAGSQHFRGKQLVLETFIGMAATPRAERLQLLNEDYGDGFAVNVAGQRMNCQCHWWVSNQEYAVRECVCAGACKGFELAKQPPPILVPLGARCEPQPAAGPAAGRATPAAKAGRIGREAQRLARAIAVAARRAVLAAGRRVAEASRFAQATLRQLCDGAEPRARLLLGQAKRGSAPHLQAARRIASRAVRWPAAQARRLWQRSRR